MDLVINDTVPTQFYCNCSREACIESADCGRKKRTEQEMIQEAKPVELKCHFCSSAYGIFYRGSGKNYCAKANSGGIKR